MPKSIAKVLKVNKLSDFEYYVSVKYKDKIYDDNFSLPGKKQVLKQIENNKSLQYIIAKAMVNAVENKTAKAEEVSNEHSKDS